nr:multicopper oxidase domain-containing protein [Streptomyces sp. NBC_00830]
MPPTHAATGWSWTPSPWAAAPWCRSAPTAACWRPRERTTRSYWRPRNASTSSSTSPATGSARRSPWPTGSAAAPPPRSCASGSPGAPPTTAPCPRGCRASSVWTRRARQRPVPSPSGTRATRAGRSTAGPSTRCGPTPPPRLGALEVWRFTSDFHHPVHLHLAHFQVLSRNGEAPGPYDAGWKDTIDLSPGEAVAIITRFTGYRGRFVFHCHNLEHEDMAMMANLEVL